MANTFTTRTNFSKDADTVMQAFATEAYHEQKAAGMGVRNVDVSVNDNGDDLSIHYNREEKSDIDVPGFAKKFVAEWNKVQQTDNWNKASKTGRTSIDISGTPVDVSGNMRLEDSGNGSVLTTDWTVKSGIPLVGGKMEKLLVQDIQAKAPRDETAANAALS